MAIPPDAEDPWLTLQDAAARAHCHPATLRRLIQAGLLRHARVGIGRKAIRLRASWLDAALEATATPLEPPPPTPPPKRRRRG